MITIIQALILGIVQGLTEFIPISSSAHLVIIPWLLNWQDTALKSLSFDVSLHLGTLAALLVFFAADWIKYIKAGFASVIERKIGNDTDRKMAWMIVLGCIPGGIAGVLFESKLDAAFHGDVIQTSSMVIMGIIIAVLGLLLFIAEKLSSKSRSMEKMSIKDGILIGVAQAFAIFPGVSRSGSTITAGLALGLEREAAARFSFLLSAPIIAGAGAKSLYEIFKAFKNGSIPHSELILFPVGFAAAAVSGFFCIRMLLKFLQKHSTSVFVYYRWVLAVLVIVVAVFRR